MQERRDFTCDSESAREGDIEIEEYEPGDIEKIVNCIFPHTEDQILKEVEYVFGGGGYFLIWAASVGQAEQLVREYLNEEG